MQIAVLHTDGRIGIFHLKKCIIDTTTTKSWITKLDPPLKVELQN